MAIEYAKQYDGFPTFQSIAIKAFNAGVESAKPVDVKKLEKELQDTKAELRHLWQTLEDPEKCADLLFGM